MNENNILYITGLIDVILNSKFRLQDLNYLNDIRKHITTMKREINRGDICNYYNKEYSTERIMGFINLLNTDIKMIKLSPVNARTKDVIEFTINEILDLLDGQRVMLSLL